MCRWTSCPVLRKQVVSAPSYSYSQEAAASTEQRSSDRSRSIKAVARQPGAEDVTLAARSAEDRVRSSSADVQSPQHLDAVVPATPNPGPRTRPQPAIDHYDAVSSFHDNFAKRTFRPPKLPKSGVWDKGV